jgi:hypothetical protein
MVSSPLHETVSRRTHSLAYEWLVQRIGPNIVMYIAIV